MVAAESVSNELILYHGSSHIIEQPVHGVGNPANDYGLGFYCTEQFDLAAEWACPFERNGFVNRYELDLTDLAVLDLGSLSGRPEQNALSWLAILVTYRRFDIATPLMQQTCNHIRSHYYVDLEPFDVIRGWRADDSYFSFARAFLDNRISLRQLTAAMALGNLGEQVVLKSERAFSKLSFQKAYLAEAARYHPKRIQRDSDARSDYRVLASAEAFRPDDLFVLDLVRGDAS